MERTVDGHKLDHLVINSTTAVAAKVRVNPALPATVVVEFMAKWLNLYPRTVYLLFTLLEYNTTHGSNKIKICKNNFQNCITEHL